MHKISSSFSSFFFLLIIGFLFFYMHSVGFLKKPESFLLSAISPLSQWMQDRSNFVDNFFFTLNGIGTFKDRVEELQSENQKLTVEISNLKEVERENQSLRKALKFKENTCVSEDCMDMILGDVISRGVDDYGKYITINIGINKGAKKNQAVVIESGIMIGKVVEVFDEYSKVMLLVSPDSSINSIAQTTRANGLSRGQYGTGVKLEMIDQSEELIKGDIIITSGLEEEIPQGLVIGKVGDIEESPNAVFKSASIELFFDFGHIEKIFLVIKNE